ncbi:hypothetical protein OAK38_06030 [Verrucomicrobia bacterium]|nr:hypothetical protein [Verrucomicrobiota bacterium]
MKVTKSKPPASKYKFNVDPEDLVPEGTNVFVFLAQKELFDIEKPKYGNPGETERIDTWRGLFGRLVDGKPYYAQTREFKQSAYPKSGLMQFLTSMLGKAPEIDSDTADLVGTGAMLTISHVESKLGTKYAAITGIAPVPEELGKNLPDVSQLPIPGEEASAPPASGSAY